MESSVKSLDTTHSVDDSSNNSRGAPQQRQRQQGQPRQSQSTSQQSTQQHPPAAYELESSNCLAFSEMDFSTRGDGGGGGAQSQQQQQCGGRGATSPAVRPVWLDVDTGVDDALALLLALRSPGLEIIGVSCVVGNSANVDIVVDATLRVLDAAAAPDSLLPCRGLGTPLIESITGCPQIHGTDSLGDLDPPLPASSRPVHAATAVEHLLATLREARAPITIIALAPLSNIATCLRIAPELCRSKIERIVWMGGASSVGGNASAWAEANAAYDPEAAHIVLTSGVPITMYTWDMYVKVAYTAPEIDALVGGSIGCEDEAGSMVENRAETKTDGGTGGGTTTSSIALPTVEAGRATVLAAATTSVPGGDGPPPRPWSELAQRLMHRDMRHFDMEEAHIGDAGVVAAVIDPDSFTTRKVHVAMELRGTHTRGMTVVDHRPVVFPPDTPKQPPNVDLCVDVDVDRIKAVFSHIVLQQGGGKG